MNTDHEFLFIFENEQKNLVVKFCLHSNHEAFSHSAETSLIQG
jgi:hypothetical protein